MSFNEANMQSLFTRWLKLNAEESAAYELKITKNRTLPFSRIAEHQITSLLKAKHEILAHKISDLAVGSFLPFDCFTLVGSAAYLVLMFYKPRMQKVCYAIDIDDVIKLKNTPNKRSISEEDARNLGVTIFL